MSHKSKKNTTNNSSAETTATSAKESCKSSSGKKCSKYNKPVLKVERPGFRPGRFLFRQSPNA